MTDQTPANVPVRVPLYIVDLGAPLLVPLQNVDDYFWLEFAPDDDTGTALVISTVQQRAAPPTLARFLSQAITDNEPVMNHRAFLSARKPDGSWPAVGFGQGARAGSLPMTLAVEDAALLANLAKRPSQQAVGRTHVDRNVSDIAATTTIYTVTSGKTFWLTDVIYAWVSVGANAVLQLTDGAASKVPLIGGAANSAENGSLSFNEPIPFTTNVTATKTLTAALLASITIVGYEEAT